MPLEDQENVHLLYHKSGIQIVIFRATSSLNLILSHHRSRISVLLADIPQERMPLFKFRELYEQRYTSSVTKYSSAQTSSIILVFSL